MLFLGIDNGASGGIAVLKGDGTIYRVDPMPATDMEILAIFEGLPLCASFAVLEHAQAFPKMGRSGAFNYGRGYGAMQMALHSAGIPFDIVVPAKWQTVLSCRTGGDKNVSKRRAEQLFPGQKITHAIADALLIAEYCRRLRIGYGKEENAKSGEAIRRLAEFDPAVGYAQGTIERLRAHALSLEQTKAGGASGHGADPQSAARSSVRGDRGAAGKDERRPRARAVRNR